MGGVDQRGGEVQQSGTGIDWNRLPTALFGASCWRRLTGTVVGALAARVAETPWVLGKERLEPLPQLVSQNLLTHTKILERAAVLARRHADSF